MRPTPLPPVLRSTFSVADARRAGVPVHRLRRGDLVAPFHAVRVVGDEAPGELMGRCAAYSTVMRRGDFFSHTTAAALYGLPLPRRIELDSLHVSSVLPTRAPKGRGIAGHALAARTPLRRVHGLPVPEPAEVWCELAALLTVDDLVVVGDALMRRHAPLCSPEELAGAVAGAGSRAGIRRLRSAAALVRPRTDSPMESVLRLAIVRAGLPEPAVNHPIVDASGRIRASADLAFPGARVIVEYDGDHHRTDGKQWQTDIDRLYVIETLGWRVVRISAPHMREGAREAVARIRGALQTTGPDMPLWSGR